MFFLFLKRNFIFIDQTSNKINSAASFYFNNTFTSRDRVLLNLIFSISFRETINTGNQFSWYRVPLKEVKSSKLIFPFCCREIVATPRGIQPLLASSPWDWQILKNVLLYGRLLFLWHVACFYAHKFGGNVWGREGGGMAIYWRATKSSHLLSKIF